MPGTASRNENRAAPKRVSPSARPIVIVTPEREVPGISASACAQPISSASRQPTEYSSRRFAPSQSASHIRIPNTESVPATNSGLRSICSMKSLNSSPTMPTGTVPIRTHQASRPSAVNPRPASELNQARAIARSSRRK